jgi:hypothetical protein
MMKDKIAAVGGMTFCRGNQNIRKENVSQSYFDHHKSYTA